MPVAVFRRSCITSSAAHTLTDSAFPDHAPSVFANFILKFVDILVICDALACASA